MHLRLVICIGLRHAELLAQGCPRGVAEELGRLARDALALVEEVIAVDLHGEQRAAGSLAVHLAQDPLRTQREYQPVEERKLHHPLRMSDP